MTKYSCSLFFDYDSINIADVFDEASSALGFTPKLMDIHFLGEDLIRTDIRYEEEIVRKAVSEQSSNIRIMNDIYDPAFRESFCWFKSFIEFDYKIYRLVWFNNNLGFLINSNTLKNILGCNAFIYGCCFDSFDVFTQSLTDVDMFKLESPNQPYEVTKNDMGQLAIDTSNHWGRSVSAGGIQFIAAPLMWFGKSFNRIISKKELLSFSSKSSVQAIQDELIRIDLFNLYDDPSKNQNRKRQREFWEYFDFESRILRYKTEKEKEAGFTDFKESLLKKKK